jgi:hypothetical protein
MKPAIVADEMFPEGAGPYMDLEEVLKMIANVLIVLSMKHCFRLGDPVVC